MQRIFLQLVRMILQIAAILLAFVAVGLYALGESVPSIGSLLFDVVFVGITGGTAAGLMFLSRKLGQRIYNMEAATLFNEIVEGQREIFSVFCDRSTSQTNCSKVPCEILRSRGRPRILRVQILG